MDEEEVEKKIKETKEQQSESARQAAGYEQEHGVSKKDLADYYEEYRQNDYDALADVEKDVLDGSTKTTWNNQEQLLKQYGAGLRRNGAKNTSIRRRTAAEAVYDELLYYVNTGEGLLPDKYDWTQTRMSIGGLVYVGRFNSKGLSVRSDSPGFSNPGLGVCPSR